MYQTSNLYSRNILYVFSICVFITKVCMKINLRSKNLFVIITTSNQLQTWYCKVLNKEVALILQF